MHTCSAAASDYMYSFARSETIRPRCNKNPYLFCDLKYDARKSGISVRIPVMLCSRSSCLAAETRPTREPLSWASASGLARSRPTLSSVCAWGGWPLWKRVSSRQRRRSSRRTWHGESARRVDVVIFFMYTFSFPSLFFFLHILLIFCFCFLCTNPCLLGGRRHDSELFCNLECSRCVEFCAD